MTLKPMRVPINLTVSLIFWLGILFPGILNAQGGGIYVQTISPEDYVDPEVATGPQNWGVIQGPRGMIYVSNTNAVLEYDGEDWRIVAGTEGKMFFKFARGKDGRIYTGGLEDLGYIEANDLGQAEFHSMLDLLTPDKREVGRVRTIAADKSGTVYFQTPGQILVWDGDVFEIFEAEEGGVFNKVFPLGETVLAVEIGVGIWGYTPDGALQLVEDRNLNALQIRGAIGNRDSILFVSLNDGLFRWVEDRLQHQPSKMDDAMIWNVASLGGDTFALTTQSQGLWIVKSDGELIRRIDESAGLPANVCVFPYQDDQGGIWIAQGNGLSRVEYPRRFSFFKEQQGFSGVPNSICEFWGGIYVGTGNGLLYLPEGQDKFEPVQGEDQEVWGLLPFEKGMLIASPNEGVKWVNDWQVRKISALPAEGMVRSQRYPNRVYLGLNGGKVASITFHGSRWEDGPVIDVGHPVYRLLEDQAGDLWVSYQEVSQIKFANGSLANATVVTYDSTAGCGPDHEEYYPFFLEGKLNWGTAKGIYAFDDAGQFLPVPGFEKHFPDQDEYAYCPAVDANGDIWALHDGQAGVFQKQEGQWNWNPVPFSREPNPDVWVIEALPDGKVWVGATSALYQFDPDIRRPQTEFSTYLRRITLGDSLLPLHSPVEEGTTLQGSREALTFTWAAPSYDAPGSNQYCYLLEGYTDEWSPWSTDHRKEFMNLPPGEYSFQVKARNIYGVESPPAAYNFRIPPPWYQAPWAIALGILLMIGFIAVLIRLNGQRIARKAERKRLADLAYQRSLLEASVTAQEQERKRIAGDLHDDIQASLATLRLKLKMLGRRTGEEPLLDESLSMVSDSIQSVRRISRDLLPASLERLGLGPALKELCKKVDGADGLKVTFSGSGDPLEIGKEAELAVFRVVQELFGNALKYAEASQIDLHLTRRETKVELTFTDNGKGFDLQKIKAGGGGLGLKNIESRLSLVGGTSAFETQPGKGTKVLIILPIQKELGT